MDASAHAWRLFAAVTGGETRRGDTLTVPAVRGRPAHDEAGSEAGAVRSVAARKGWRKA